MLGIEAIQQIVPPEPQDPEHPPSDEQLQELASPCYHLVYLVLNSPLLGYFAVGTCDQNRQTYHELAGADGPRGTRNTRNRRQRAGR